MYGVRVTHSEIHPDALYGILTEKHTAMNPLPDRKTIRLRHYDYRSKGVYHVTICAQYRKCIFGRIEKGQMILSSWGNVVEEQLDEISMHYPEFELIAHVVMPNHVHLLAGLGIGEDAMHGVPTVQHTLGQIIGAFKASVSRVIGQGVWQSRFYEHIIRNDVDLRETFEYIRNNHLAWEKDDYYLTANP